METGFADAFALAEKILEALVWGGEPGIVLSIDIGNSLFDLLAASTAGSAGCDLVRSPSLLRYRAHLSSLGARTKVASVLAEPVVFGRIDGFVLPSEEREPLEGYGSRREPFATRSIDSWMMDRAPLRLAQLGDPDMVEDHLAGAAKTIARDRPVLTLYPAHQDRAALLSRLELLGYRTFNLAAQTPRVDEFEPAVDFGWIAVPEERATSVAAAAAAHFEQSNISGQELLKFDADCAALPRQRRSHAVFGLPPGASIPASRVFAIDDVIGVNDLYSLETEGSHSWRWLGPGPSSLIAVPCPLPGPYRIQVGVLGCQLENGLADCRIIAEGREVKISGSKSAPGSMAFACQLRSVDYAGYMEVNIVSAGRALSAGKDPRTLRLSIQSISVSQAQ
ncbi:MAG TPA: hypothetical protein VIY09_05935 [Rhizomicrobium sp.]